MKRQEKFPDTDCFVYENLNPKKKVTTDCVVRATCKALGKPYIDVYQDMFGFSISSGLHLNDKKFLKKYLEHLGYGMLKQPKHQDNTKYTAREFAKEFNKGIYIVSIRKHITVIVDGKIHDIWDCSDKAVGNYWKIRGGCLV